MRSTIGEIADLLSPFCNLIEMSTVKGFPFLRAFVGSDGITKCYMYVKQIDEHVYAACDDRDDHHGRRYFPTGSITKPFVIEQELIQSWFSKPDVDPEYYKSVRNSLTYQEFHGYMYERLLTYGIIRLDQNVRDIQISSMDFTSVKIKRTIDRIMKGHGYRVGTIGDLFDIVVVQQKPLILDGLKSKEVQVLVNKLRCAGVKCIMDGNTIVGLQV